MPMDMSSVLDLAERGIRTYLEEALDSGQIDAQLYKQALDTTFGNLKDWLLDPDIDAISPNLKTGIVRVIEGKTGDKKKSAKKGDEEEDGKWRSLVNAFRQQMRFGTGGIRGMMAFDKRSIEEMHDPKGPGLNAPILKGPNTFNDLVLLLTSAGVAKYGRDHNLAKVVVGYDSRVRGADLATLVARAFLTYGFTVYFFDAPCPYPEVTFAVPYPEIQADIGILISASHNDYRYNGFKLSCGNGSQFDPEERDVIFRDYIDRNGPNRATTKDLTRLVAFRDAPKTSLFFLGGDEPAPGFDYAGKEDNLIDLHGKHRNHVKSFLMTDDLAKRQASAPDPLKIGFCAFYGAGGVAVPRLLREAGFREVWPITQDGLNECNGLFPCFDSNPGRERQPDPGDPRAASIAVSKFKEEYPNPNVPGAEKVRFEDIDILIGTDPDADRCGVVVKVPEEQRFIYGDNDWTLLGADDLWALLLWYRLFRETEKYGAVRDAEKKFITLSHTTSDSILRLALKHGLGVVKTWVGFASLAGATRDIWDGKWAEYARLVEGRDPAKPGLCHPMVCDCLGMENAKRSINVGAMEQSNGFSILGGPPPNKYSLGEGGHVRDKDGTFAAFLVAEVAAWAKEQGTTLFKLVDEKIASDPQVGLFVNGYQPDPMDGEYPGIEGDRLKKQILRRVLGYFQLALAGDFEIAGVPVATACVYRTGKYDTVYPPTYDFQFPDEGIRFFFDRQALEKRLGSKTEDRLNHVTIRPSGTGNSLRFHTQLHDNNGDEILFKRKYRLRSFTDEVFVDLRAKLRAPKGILAL